MFFSEYFKFDKAFANCGTYLYRFSPCFSVMLCLDSKNSVAPKGGPNPLNVGLTASIRWALGLQVNIGDVFLIHLTNYLFDDTGYVGLLTHFKSGKQQSLSFISLLQQIACKFHEHMHIGN